MADEALAKGELRRVTPLECVTGNEFLVSIKPRKRFASAQVFRLWPLELMATDEPMQPFDIGAQWLRAVIWRQSN